MTGRDSILRDQAGATAAMLLAALVGTVGCGAAEPPVAVEAVVRPTANPVRLDHAEPAARVTIDPGRIGGDVIGLLVPVVRVRNPRLVAVQVHVILERRVGESRRSTPLGTFSLFPADQPGTFTIPFAGARLLAPDPEGKPADGFDVVFRLESIVAEETFRDVSLEIGALRWIS